MALEPGKQLLHYRLIEKIGEGGMGAVWKAVDTDLGREVAIKSLPEAFADDAARRTRFEREAQLLASLNHPGIAAVYGLHECDTSTGSVRFLAMELVQGEDLSVRLSRGRLPIEDALDVAVQVCEACAAAHDAGVVHRDLKPANVMLTPEGKVRVLDFGLAKAMAGDPASGSGLSASLSPTMMTSAGTQAGVILGTAAYMSPEQARGRPVDRRADIWALGCLLFEMLTGSAAFGGETVTDTLAAVVRAEPDWTALPPQTRPGVHRVLRRTLVKDPAERLRDAGDVRLELSEALAGAGEAEPGAGVAAAPGARASGWRGGALGAVGGALLALVAAWYWMSPAPSVEQTGKQARFEIVAATGEAAIRSWGLDLSPDGRRVVWTVEDGAKRSIWLRALDSLEARRLPDTDGGTVPTFSPDGRSIAFFAGNKLRRLDLEDRRAIDLCESIDGAGIAWNRDGTILFNSDWLGPLLRVSAEGGTPDPATRLDEQDGEIGHWFPQMLPDGRHVLLSRWRTNLNDMSVGVASLDTGEIRDLVPRASFAQYVPSGHLLFTRAGAIYVVEFDAEGLEVTGRPELVVDGVEQLWSNGRSTWTASDNGVLAYIPGGLWTTKRTVMRVSKDGVEEPLDVEPGAYLHVSMAPDGKRVALTEFANGDTDVVIRDLERGIDTVVPLDAANCYALWSPDSRSIVFNTALKGPWDIYRYRITGDDPEVLVEDVEDKIPLAWSSDGRYLVWDHAYREARTVDLGGDGTSKAVAPATDAASISPDGRWIAWERQSAAGFEVVVRAFPDGTRDSQVSVGGGFSPIWSRDGSKVFYRQRGGAVLSVDVRVEDGEIVAGRPEELFRGDYVGPGDRLEWSYDPTRDASVLIKNGEGEIWRDRFVVVMDWGALAAR